MKATLSLLFLFVLNTNFAFALTTLPAEKDEVSQLKSNFVEIAGKKYFASGDQLFDPEMIENVSPTAPPYLAASYGKLKKWEDGVLPLEFSKNVPNWLQQRVFQTCQEWAMYGNIKCQLGKYKNRSLLVSTNRKGCWATMGMGGLYNRRMNLQLNGCEGREVILHELGHALGMIHEHQRTDRDLYVDIQNENIDGSFIVKFNFKTLASELHTPYDFYSIMHYGYYFFSNEGATTIQPKPEYMRYKYEMGSVKNISPLDQYAIGEMYGRTALTPEITEAIERTYKK